MNIIGNILWLIFGGLITSFWYFVSGLLMCITIIGIPFGIQMFKFAKLSLWPFGHEVTDNGPMGCLSLGFNILWICFGWWEIALTHLIFGLIFCITIAGIPLGIQHFKLAIYTIFPFGRTIK